MLHELMLFCQMVGLDVLLFKVFGIIHSMFGFIFVYLALCFMMLILKS